MMRLNIFRKLKLDINPFLPPKHYYGGPQLSRQYQFGHGNINLATAISIWPWQFQFGHGNFNLATAISIWPRQFQFGHSNFNLATAKSIWSRQNKFTNVTFMTSLSSQFAVGVYPTWRWVNGTTVENVLCKLWIYGLARSQLLRAVRKRWVFIRL